MRAWLPLAWAGPAAAVPALAAATWTLSSTAIDHDAGRLPVRSGRRFHAESSRGAFIGTLKRLTVVLPDDLKEKSLMTARGPGPGHSRAQADDRRPGP